MIRILQVFLIVSGCVLGGCGGGSNGDESPISGDDQKLREEAAQSSTVVGSVMSKFGFSRGSKSFLSKAQRLKQSSDCELGGSVDVTEDDSATFQKVVAVFSACREPAEEGLIRTIDGRFSVEDLDETGSEKRIEFGEGETPLTLALMSNDDREPPVDSEISVTGENLRKLDSGTGDLQTTLSVNGQFIDSNAGTSLSYLASDFRVDFEDSAETTSIDINGVFGGSNASTNINCRPRVFQIETIDSLVARDDDQQRIESGQLAVSDAGRAATSQFNNDDIAVTTEQQTSVFSQSELIEQCRTLQDALSRLLIDFQ